MTETEKLTELLPCPICGADAAINQYRPSTEDDDGDGPLPCQIMCQNRKCWVRTPYGPRDEVIAIWNRRAPKTAVRTTPIPINLPFDRLPQHAEDPGYGPVPSKSNIESIRQTPGAPAPAAGMGHERRVHETHQKCAKFFHDQITAGAVQEFRQIIATQFAAVEAQERERCARIVEKEDYISAKLIRTLPDPAADEKE